MGHIPTSSSTPPPERQQGSQAPGGANAITAHEKAPAGSGHLGTAVAGCSVINYVIGVLTSLEIANNVQVAQYNDIQNLYNQQVSDEATLMTTDSKLLPETIPAPTSSQLNASGQTGIMQWEASTAYRNAESHNEQAGQYQAALQSQVQVQSTSASLYGSQGQSTTSMIGQMMPEIASFIQMVSTGVSQIFRGS